jgi:hypothetical protein
MLKRILNVPEKQTHRRLQEICGDYGTEVFSKVRLADILPIEGSGIQDREYRYALQAHFDFTMATKDATPLFAVEFDGPSHAHARQAYRDDLKDSLCARFQFPILRISSEFVTNKYRSMDLLGWLVEVWFLQKDFYLQQAAGVIAYDEPFDPRMVISRSNKPGRFPFWLSAPILTKVQRLFFEGKCKDPSPSWTVSLDRSNNYHGLAWLALNADTTVYAQTKFRGQLFPVTLVELVSDIATYEMHALLTKVLEGTAEPQPFADFDHILAEFKKEYSLCGGATCGSSGIFDGWRL